MSREHPDPWMPERRPLPLAILGKLAEEAGELASAASRCIIQGIDEREPETGKPNREWLEDEIADVLACIAVAKAEFALDDDRIAERIERKSAHIARWFAMIDNAERAKTPTAHREYATSGPNNAVAGRTP